MFLYNSTHQSLILAKSFINITNFHKNVQHNFNATHLCDQKRFIKKRFTPYIHDIRKLFLVAQKLILFLLDILS